MYNDYNGYIFKFISFIRIGTRLIISTVLSLKVGNFKNVWVTRALLN